MIDMKYNRIQEIENYIKNAKVASLDELLNQFDISIQTLRRDLKELENRNVIKKVYGGVVYNEDIVANTEVIDIKSREIENLNQKQQIGKVAASLLEEQDVIFIDSGTTACQIIPFMNEDMHLTVITHSALAFEMLEGKKNVKIILLGGEYREKVKSFFFDVSALHYNFAKSFISTYGLSLENVLTNMDNFEGMVKNHVIHTSKEVIVLADDTKFSRVSYNCFAPIDSMNVVVTNKLPNKRYMNYFNENDILIRVP